MQVWNQNTSIGYTTLVIVEQRLWLHSPCSHWSTHAPKAFTNESKANFPSNVNLTLASSVTPNLTSLLDNNTIQYVGYYRVIVLMIFVLFSLFNLVCVAYSKSLQKLIKSQVWPYRAGLRERPQREYMGRDWRGSRLIGARMSGTATQWFVN